MSPAKLAQLPKLFARTASALVFFTGALVLLGWTLNIPALMNVVPGWPKMAASSALGFFLAGFALWCAATGTELNQPAVAQRNSRHFWRRSVVRGGGVAVMIIGLFKLSEFLGGWSFGM